MKKQTPRRFPYKRLCVFGAARSGVAAMHLLRHHDVDVVLVDEKPAKEFRSLIRRIHRLHVTEHFGKPINPSVLNGCEGIVLSPGIRLDHPLVEEAIERELPVISEVELASFFARSPIIAITGTNGKTTTTTLTGKMIADSGVNAVVSGNIGRAFSDGVLSSQETNRPTILVTEVSSFQLESIDEFRPHIAAILNITRDHMDRYGSMREYIEAKFQITKNQTEEDYLILNQDDPVVMSAAEHSDAQIYTFSMQGDRIKQGAFVEGDRIYLKENGEIVPFCNVSEIPIPGRHNVENTLASVVMCRRAGVKIEQLLATLRRFNGVEHRCEPVAATKDDIRFYNDSKATNVDSLEKALMAFDRPIVLIAGGKDKASAYDRLNQLVQKKVKALVLIGEAGPIINKHWGKLVPTRIVPFNANDPNGEKAMTEAVKIAAGLAQSGDVVLLSPACASFDQFKDYEDRGMTFKRVVRNFLGL